VCTYRESFAGDFVPLALEFVAFAIEFIQFAVKFATLTLDFIALAIYVIKFICYRIRYNCFRIHCMYVTLTQEVFTVALSANSPISYQSELLFVIKHTA